MGVATGCGCKEVYRFPHTTYPYILLLYMFFFAAASLLFVHLKKCFSFLLQFFFVNKINYIFNIFFVQYKHTHEQLRASHGSHMTAACFIHEAHTNVRFISCNGHQLYV